MAGRELRRQVARFEVGIMRAANHSPLTFWWPALAFCVLPSIAIAAGLVLIYWSI